MRRHDVTTVRHRLPTTLAVSSSGPYPRLKKKTLCGPWTTKKTDGLWWVGVCLFGWGSRSPLGTRSVTSNPSPASLDLWGPAAGEMVTRVGVSDVIPMHNSKRPRVPRVVPSFSEHRNSVLLRCATQNEASILSFRKPPFEVR